jgi:hypothetical protein
MHVAEMLILSNNRKKSDEFVEYMIANAAIKFYEFGTPSPNEKANFDRNNVYRVFREKISEIYRNISDGLNHYWVETRIKTQVI